MTQQFLKALERLDEFCQANNINYMLTGTTALCILGLTPKKAEVPGDIDILFGTSCESATAFRKQELLSGLENETYTDRANFTFKVNDVKVNAMAIDPMSILPDSLIVSVPCTNKRLNLRIQKPYSALKAKAKLKRLKDYQYIINLIREISDLL